MNILMFINRSKNTFLATELKAEPQRKATIATTTQCEVQRMHLFPDT